MKDEIINLCSLIKKCKCVCGSNKYIDSCCKYCGTENDTVKQLVSSLLKSMNFCEFDEEILLSLNSISYLNILEINEMLNKHKFNDVLNKKYKEINERIINQEYKNEDFKYLLYFVENNYYTQENIMYISNFLMKNFFIGNVDASIEEQLRFIIIYTENIMKAVYPKVSNPKCELTELDENTVGESFSNIIELDKNKILSYLQNKKYYEILSTIFHECTHTLQHYSMFSNDSVSYMMLLIAKEDIISTKITNYYNDNYLKHSHEVDARIGQNVLLLKFIENNNLTISKEQKDKINKTINFERQLIADETRKVNEQTTNIDILFDMLELDSNILKKYPILNFQYKELNGKIVKKTKEELTIEYNNYLNSNTTINGDKAYIDYLYNSLINKTNSIEGIKR